MRVVALVSLWCGLTQYSLATPNDIQAGQQKSASCAGCHGAQGIAPSANFPNLAGQSAKYLTKQLHDFKQAGQGRDDPMMSSFSAPLSATDIAQLAAYYASLPPSKPSAPLEDDTGKRLYLGGDMARDIAACSACHGVNGQGLAAAGFPALAGQHALYTEQQLTKFKQGQRHNDINNMMTDISRKLTPAEITALAAYIATLAPPKATN
ncbi:cytochrome c4 [Shewanella sp. C32]|uniref:Cytochrome c4 n=1 Tax=Shewanella electrica TaxID=515560 RepID=A0ABT2FLJ8_9GAMM|nr:c-type cytochrome [Shewanella electrica]MCH1925900.1 cytochrome c4 [Shewanella electrica]MCS4557215.1 cytochrome c4 [Shewanella electrica]